MNLHHITINNLRNINAINIDLSPRFNILVGENGSGKTSFLEAIHLLSLGRSFRSYQYKPLITHEKTQMIVRGVLANRTTIGVEKNHGGKSRIHINEEPCTSAAALAELLPLLLINPDSYKILEAGSKYRREFLDWGVFHVKHQFFELWRQSAYIIKQRNAAIRQQQSRQHLAVWDISLIDIAAGLDNARKDYLTLLMPIYKQICEYLLGCDVQMNYYQGWNKDLSLHEVIERSFERDKQLGYTQYGPHRADLRLTIDNRPVKDVLSRGQHKLLICAMKIAQGMLLREQNDKSCVYLLDDLAAELDSQKREKMMTLLSKLNAQVFATAVDKSALCGFDSLPDTKLFHVEHGDILHPPSSALR